MTTDEALDDHLLILTVWFRASPMTGHVEIHIDRAEEMTRDGIIEFLDILAGELEIGMTRDAHTRITFGKVPL